MGSVLTAAAESHQEKEEQNRGVHVCVRPPASGEQRSSGEVSVFGEEKVSLQRFLLFNCCGGFTTSESSEMPESIPHDELFGQT